MLLTRLEGIVGAEKRRPAGAGFDRTSGQTWHDVRRERSSYEDRDPEVIVVGGGHHGLFSAVHLQELGVDVLVVDRFPRAGDNWRTRYASLALHNETDMVHFPGLHVPRLVPAVFAEGPARRLDRDLRRGNATELLEFHRVRERGVPRGVRALAGRPATRGWN